MFLVFTLTWVANYKVEPALYVSIVSSGLFFSSYGPREYIQRLPPESGILSDSLIVIIAYTHSRIVASSGTDFVLKEVF